MKKLPPPVGPPVGSGPEPVGSPTGKAGIVRRAGSTYLKWPLWAKIGVPGALLVVGSVAAGGSDTDQSDSASASDVSTTVAEVEVNQFAEVATSTVAPTLPPTTPAPTQPPTTPATTLPPTTPAPAPVAPVQTQPPTTLAPVAPATTLAPVAPPPSGLDPDYGTCKEAKAHGAGPYYQGQDPEYDWYRDADKDGIVCE